MESIKERIIEAMNGCDDEELLDLVWKLLINE